MNTADQTTASPREVVHILAVNARRWLVPAIVFAVLAAGYALVRPATWEASQALMVRNEAVNNELGPGKFGDPQEMKTVQETILELAKSSGVLRATLEEVGPAANYRGEIAAWPTARDIVKARKRIELAPPKGAEFGKTEVFYLRVHDHDRVRAVAVNRAICDQLEARFQQLRDAKAQSMINELSKTLELAKADLAESTARLTVIEREAGSDLAELRVLNEPGSGTSELRQTVGEIRNELRQICATQKANEQLSVLLEEAQEDPSRLVATPNRLLVSQPALRRLKDGLVDAQLRTAALKGKMTDAHPVVQSAQLAEEEIRRELHAELAAAVRGLQVELRLDSDRMALLEEQMAKTTERLDYVAGLRVPYASYLAEAENRTRRVDRAEQDHANARATHASAKETSLISRIDAPETDVNPMGTSRSMIVLIGLAGGLLTGFGIVFLTVPPIQPATDKQVPSIEPSPSHQSVLKPAESVLQADENLSFNEALRKIDFSSKV